jgi:hypothetical protein
LESLFECSFEFHVGFFHFPRCPQDIKNGFGQPLSALVQVYYILLKMQASILKKIVERAI